MPFNPLSYDRFGYVFNNPINYTDPSGLCRMVANPYGAGTHFEYSEDCTVEEFNELSWTYRILWLQIFAQIHELGDWLDDIKQVIIDFSQDPDLNDLGGYIALADAAVLQAIQNGWRMYTGQEIICGSQCDLAHTAAEGWSAFFGGYKGGGYTLDELISMRLGAEQGGVNYATALADEQGLYDKASPTEQVKISLFIWGSNLYRDFGATYHATGAPCPSWSLCPVVTDPRRSTDFLGPLAWTLVPTIATIAGAIADCFYATGNASCFTGGGR